MFRVLLAAVLFAVTPSARAAEDLVRWVNPLIGTDNERDILRGDTLPLAALPFGMASWTPQNTLTHWIYLYKSKFFHGIRLTHQPSPWIGDYGNFLITPLTGNYNGRVQYPLDHRQEIAAPHYYSLRLSSPGIHVEVAPSMRGGVLRFTFPASAGASVLVDIPGIKSTAKVIAAHGRLEGVSNSNTRGVPKNKKFGCYFVMEADAPITAHEIWEENQPPYHVVNKSGRHAMALLRFGELKNKQVTLRVGTSFISIEQAELNLKREIGASGLEDVSAAAKAAWQKQLERVTIEGADKSQRTIFYTALYHALLFPRTFHEPDEDGRLFHYSPYDGKVHAGPLYTDNGFWDTFRTVYPFFSIFMPERLSEMLQGFVNAYHEGGWLPQWQSPGYQSSMIGTHSDAIFADAVVKGVRGFDVDTAYKASLKNGDVQSERGQYGRIGLDDYTRLGYVPADKVDQSVSRTLDYAYDDFCLSQFAGAMGKEKDQKRFLERSKNFKNIFNPKTGFMQGRLSNGGWLEPFSPFEWGSEFTEGNSWQHSFFAPHAVEELISLMGGKKDFEKRLDTLFALPPGHLIGNPKKIYHDMHEMVRAKMGQYHHGNQPSHHIAYLYNYTDAPWKTQARVREIMARLYQNTPGGLIGDDDNGEMSAWYIFSAMGFYPLCPGKPEYEIGSPLFRKLTLQLADGKNLTVEAVNNSPANVYVQSIEWNGSLLQRTKIYHAELIKGGTLRFVMGNSPKKP